MDKPKKIYEAVEELRKDSVVLIEDIGEATAVIRGYIDKLKPYIWYFNLIYSRYLQSHPNALAELTMLNVILASKKNTPLTSEQSLMFAIMHIKMVDQTVHGIKSKTDMFEKSIIEYTLKFSNINTGIKELKSMYLDSDKIYTLLHKGEVDIVRISARYIELMKKLQADYPSEYAKFTLEEGAN